MCAAVLAATVDVDLRALRERAPEHPALPRFTELATLFTGAPDARPADAIVWLNELTSALAVPGLAHYGLDNAGSTELIREAQRASSMRANPIDLTDAEVGEIIALALSPQ